MRLTAELVEHAPQRMNPVLEREIILRGFKIPAIENTGTLRDAFDCIDLSDNEIKVLGNFARSPRVTMVLLSNNMISKIDATFGQGLPNLQTLVLTNNSIERFEELQHLASCTKLQVLSLVNNPVSRSPHYRPYVIAKAPASLKLLDFRKIKPVERQEALKLFPVDGPPLVDMSKPPPRPPSSRPHGVALRNLTEDQKAAIKAAVAAAKTPEDVDRLEQQLRAGIFPGSGDDTPAPPAGPPPASAFRNGHPHPPPGPPPGPPPRRPPGPPPASSLPPRPPPPQDDAMDEDAG